MNCAHCLLLLLLIVSSTTVSSSPAPTIGTSGTYIVTSFNDGNAVAIHQSGLTRYGKQRDEYFPDGWHILNTNSIGTPTQNMTYSSCGDYTLFHGIDCPGVVSRDTIDTTPSRGCNQMDPTGSSTTQRMRVQYVFSNAFAQEVKIGLQFASIWRCDQLEPTSYDGTKLEYRLIHGSTVLSSGDFMVPCVDKTATELFTIAGGTIQVGTRLEVTLNPLGNSVNDQTLFNIAVEAQCGDVSGYANCDWSTSYAGGAGVSLYPCPFVASQCNNIPVTFATGCSGAIKAANTLITAEGNINLNAESTNTDDVVEPNDVTVIVVVIVVVGALAFGGGIGVALCVVKRGVSAATTAAAPEPVMGRAVPDVPVSATPVVELQQYQPRPDQVYPPVAEVVKVV